MVRSFDAEFAISSPEIMFFAIDFRGLGAAPPSRAQGPVARMALGYKQAGFLSTAGSPWMQ
jgi:hypothetical protein